MVVITIVRLGYRPTYNVWGTQIVAISQCSQGFFLCVFLMYGDDLLWPTGMNKNGAVNRVGDRINQQSDKRGMVPN